MDEMMSFLRQKNYSNIYMIRGLRNNIRDLRFLTKKNDKGDIAAVVGIWEEDRAVTLRGEPGQCQEWFYRFHKEYDFYELDEQFIKVLLEENKVLADSKHISFYYIMVHDKVKAREVEYGIQYEKINKNQWHEVSKLYRDQYDIKFSGFQPENMEWLVVYEEGFPVGNLCLERGDEDLFVLSNFHTAPDWRNRGIGTGLLQTVCRDYENHKICLFVSCENEGAVRLYKRLGFQIRDKVGNIERRM